MRLMNPVRDIRTIKTLLTGAEVEAHEAGQTRPGAEHLLLSAIALPDGTARRAFERLGADPDEFRSAIATQHEDALRAIGIEPPGDDVLHGPAGGRATPGTGVFRATASAQAAFRAAADLAKADTGSPLLGAHVVAAVARMEHGSAARALRAMGIDRHALAAASRLELEDRRT